MRPSAYDAYAIADSGIFLESALPMLEVALITIVCFSFFVLIYSQKLPLLLSCSKRNGMNA